MGGPRIWRALGLAALLATCGEPQAGIARASEEIGALVGAELEPVGSLGSTVVDLIGSLSGTDESRPEITRVRVLTDREQRADLEVFVRHAAGGQAWARVLDHEGRALAGLESARVEISGDEVSVQIGLELPGSLPETFEAQSTAVDVYVARAGKRVSGAADTVRRYAFPKRWQARVPPERRVLRVRPEPIGAAARLGVRSRAAAEADEIYPSEGMVPLHPPEAVRTRGTSPVERAHRAMEEARQRQRFEAERARRDAARDRARQKARKRQRDREKQEARDRAKEKAREETARRREQRGRDEAVQRDRAEEQRRRREAAEAARREREEEERRRREELEAAEVEVERLEEELEAQRQLGATGPSPTAAIDPLEGLLLEPTVDVRADEILDVWPLVWLDANPTSGVAYFAPRRFALGWSPEDAYSFQVVYGLAVDDGTADRVRVSTRLRSRVGGAEIQRLQGLIEAYGRRHAERRFEFRELSRLPIRGRELTLTGALERQFSISPEVVTVTTDSDLLGAIDLSWTTDEATLLDIQSLLRADAGIHGSMVVQASGEPAFEVPVPVEIAVATPGVLGRIGWDRRRGWRNDTFYPVRLRYLHALVLNQRHEPLLYSWDLGDANVAAGTLVEWDATRVPSFVDDDALQMWIDYAVDADCESCDDLVFDDRFIPELPASHALRFTSTNAFEASGAFRIVVHVRSLYFDGRTEQLRSVEMRTDEEPYGAGTLYLEDGQLAAADSTRPLYEYRIELITEDGEVLESAQWLPGWRTDQFIGRASLREAFGFVPGEEAAP